MSCCARRAARGRAAYVGEAKTAASTHEYDSSATTWTIQAMCWTWAIAGAGLRASASIPMGGASVAFWAPIAGPYGLNLKVVNDTLDPAFGFMSVDHDGKIRMDCSSPHAMAPPHRTRRPFHRVW